MEEVRRRESGVGEERERVGEAEPEPSRPKKGDASRLDALFLADSVNSKSLFLRYRLLLVGEAGSGVERVKQQQRSNLGARERKREVSAWGWGWGWGWGWRGAG
jgi:hypothetical protein